MIFQHRVRKPDSDTKRARKIRSAVDRGLAGWSPRTEDLHAARSSVSNAVSDSLTRIDLPEFNTFAGNGHRPESREDVIRSMPRRKRLTPDVVHDIQPRTIRLAKPFKASIFYSFRRLFIWIRGIFSFLWGTLWDQLRRRNTLERRAIRLRQTFARIGGTFIKFGQQMSIRIDLFPYQYCVELTKLLDKVEPFPTEQAIEAFEEATGKQLHEVFAEFDPDPIGSASIACVYQARLLSGEYVAVKVRRPGVGEMIVADLRVLGWLFRFLEFTTIIRPGFTANMLQELRNTLLEELDFYKEARFQELFRRRSKDAEQPYFSAPLVYPELSFENIITEEFVSGVWLSELIAAVEHNHEEALAYIRELNIEPKLVARRLLWASYWGLWENVFFHADPHPANIIIQRDSRLMFIDFGSSGSLTESRRLAMHEVFAREKEEDLEGIARVSLTLLEPLPPVDTEKVIKAIEHVHWDAMIAQRSRHSEWWEKTSANLWLGFFKVTNEFKIPMSVDHVRMIRATLLYDTLAARLDHSIDLGHEYRQFMKDIGNKKRRIIQKKVRKRIKKGLTERDYVRLDRMVKMGDRLLYLGQRLLNLRSFNFGSLLGKFVSSVILLITLIFQTLGITALILLGIFSIQRLTGNTMPDFRETFESLFTNPWYLTVLVVLVFISVRRILFRLADEEVR